MSQVQELLQLPENSRCADCGQPDPVWASCNVGVFVCLECSGVHRISSIGRVKSTQLDYMEHDLIEFMRRHGNGRARETYEARLPPFYYRPSEKDFKVLREQWIRAKYERREFMSEAPSLYAVDYKEGFLWKKGRDNGQYLRRLFTFSQSEGLQYYTKDKSFKPKGKFPLRSLNAMFQCEKMQQEHGLEITYAQDGRTRSIYVYHEDGAEIVTWYNVLRAARYRFLKETFPDAPEAELIPKITHSYSKCGYMEKTGPTHREPFKKRWFSLDAEERRLLYYKKPLDPYEQGRVLLGSSEDGFQVMEGFPNGLRGSSEDAALTICTPQRRYILICENGKERSEWVQALQEVLRRPKSTHHTAEEDGFRRSAVK